MKGNVIFVYNANSGIMQGAFDYIHKIVSPHTYDCSLCGVTYGLLGMKKQWRHYIQSLPYDVSFLYRDTVPEQLKPFTPTLPVALFVDEQQHVFTLLSAEDFQRIQTLDQCLHEVKHALQTLESNI